MDKETIAKLDTIKPLLNSLSESLAKMKAEVLENKDKSQGGIDMVDEKLVKELEDTKAALVEAKAAKDKEIEEAKAAVKAEFEAEAAKKAEKDAADKLAADEKAENDKGEATKALAEAAAAKKESDKKDFQDKMKKAMSSEELADLGIEFSDAEKAIASEKSYADLVKLVASLNSELAEVHAAKAEAEAKTKAEARYKELAEKGLAFIGVKGNAQKEKLASLDDSAFASYTDELSSIAETLNNKEGFNKDAIEAAKASVGVLSQEADLDMDNKSKFAQLRA